MEEKTCMLQESLALEATEKSFYDVIGEIYPPSVDHHGTPSIDENHQAQYENSSTSSGGDSLVEPRWNWRDVGEYGYPYMTSQSTSPPFTSSNSANDKFVDDPNIFCGSECSPQFRSRVEEARKFLPNGNTLFVGMVINNLSGLLAGDQRTATDQLKRIRQHVSPTGDGMQRVSHYFANGLEARLAGTGTQIYKAVFTKATSAADILKAYHLFLAMCPFKKLLINFFSNTTIRKLAEKAETLHIIDFGITYGFQWPSLIQCLSSRPAGPPKLRITGIDLPQPGFRPAERVQETGRRLANYESFNSFVFFRSQ